MYDEGPKCMHPERPVLNYLLICSSSQAHTVKALYEPFLALIGPHLCISG